MCKTNSRPLNVIALAMVVAVVAWGIFRVAGIDFELKDDAVTDRVGVLDVAVATMLAGFAAWGVHELMVRLGKAKYWPFLGTTLLSISMVGPGRMADGEDAIALIALHFVAGITLITGLAMVGGCADDETQDRDGRKGRAGSAEHHWG